MAGSLIKIDEEIVTSAVASVTLTGIDSTYDVYMVRFSGLTASANALLYARVTESGTANTTANYDNASKRLKTNATFDNDSATNATAWNFAQGIDDGTNVENNGIVYCFNFNNSSEYSFITVEYSSLNANDILASPAGGGVFTSSSSCDGIQFLLSTGNITGGTFTLYGLKK